MPATTQLPAKPIGNIFGEAMNASFHMAALTAHLAIARDDSTGLYAEASRDDLARVRKALDKIDRALTAASAQRSEAA